jgi:hypothetical protein
MPFGFARVVHEGGSATEVAVTGDNSFTAAIPRLAFGWSMSF